MNLKRWSAFAWMSVVTFACAKGTTDTSTDDTSSTSQTTNVGGMAGAGGVGGVGGIGGIGGQGGEPEMPIPCADPADTQCKLTMPQCGCLSTERCIAGGDGNRYCAPKGDKAPLSSCADDCTQGFQCVNNGATGLGRICHQLCSVDADCNNPSQGPGGLCVVPVLGGAGTACSQNCDPVTDSGCKEANPNLKCDLAREQGGAQRWFTRCTNKGAIAPDGACTSATQCSPGSSCIPVDMEPVNHCLAWCKNPNSGGVCPQGGSHACSGFLTPISIGGIEYGACIPLGGF